MQFLHVRRSISFNHFRALILIIQELVFRPLVPLLSQTVDFRYKTQHCVHNLVVVRAVGVYGVQSLANCHSRGLISPRFLLCSVGQSPNCGPYAASVLLD